MTCRVKKFEPAVARYRLDLLPSAADFFERLAAELFRELALEFSEGTWHFTMIGQIRSILATEIGKYLWLATMCGRRDLCRAGRRVDAWYDDPMAAMTPTLHS